MKAVKETVRKYYKYQYSSWTRPDLSSNGVLGGNSFAVAIVGSSYNGDAYQSFDGSTSTSFRPYAGNGLIFYNPIPLNITNLACDVAYSNEGISVGTLYASNDNTNWDLISNNIGGGQTWSNSITMTGYYKYFKLMSDTVLGGRGSVAELLITATQRTTTTGTASDYDYYEDVEVYKAVNETIRKYYKYDTQNPQYNYTPVGTITNNNGVLSGFTTSNYASISNSFDPQSNEWEMIIPYITTNISSAQYILGTDNYGVCIGINDSSQARIYLSSNNSSWDIADGTTSTISLSANTQYYFKLTRTSSSYVLSVSTDKTNYTTHITVSSSATIPSSQLKFGVSRSNVQPATYGSIDLNDAQITVGGLIWWQGKTYPALPATSSDYDFYKDVDVYEVVKN